MSGRLYESLKEYCDSDFYPFHMPGHKRNLESGPLAEIYHCDITEIDGFDNLHQPETLIREAEERAARFYHSEETCFLVNGSTAGILGAISSIAGQANKLIISRNCHRAVYHAAFLNQMELYYVYPQQLEDYAIAGPVTAKDIQEAVKDILAEEGCRRDRARECIAGVVITSPTYDGIVSDVREIAELVHSYGIPLIVDQAHGAHFGIHPAWPENAVREGADIVIHSVHKTLPAPTQTALIHRNGSLTDGRVLRRYLRIYQSSSPSYLLMAGIDEAVFLAAGEGKDRLEKLLSLRSHFLSEMEKCRHIRICPVTEPGKLVIAVKDFPATGQMLYDLLREKYHLQMEMASGNYVLAILTMMEKEEGIRRLLEALLEIDREMTRSACARQVEKSGTGQCLMPIDLEVHPFSDMNLWEAYGMPYREVSLAEAKGETAAEFVNLYPPGIPLLVPGERVEAKLIEMISFYLQNNYTVQGVYQNKLKVVKK